MAAMAAISTVEDAVQVGEVEGVEGTVVDPDHHTTAPAVEEVEEVEVGETRIQVQVQVRIQTLTLSHCV